MGAWAKWRNLVLLSVAELLAMSLWFSGSAVVPQLVAEWQLSSAEQALMTTGVQIGFVLGALASALANLPDRVALHRLLALSCLAGASFNAAISVFEMPFQGVIGLRLLTGVALAGVYPPAMKLAATWSQHDRGLVIGILIGALTIGSAMPHLLNGLGLFADGGMPPWREVLQGSSALALIAFFILLSAVRAGPLLAEQAPFDWKFVGRILHDRPVRLANGGYLGHMWELYAMWTWVPLLVIASYREAGWDAASARMAGFSIIAVGGAGCVLAGLAADRLGRTAVTIGSLAISGMCALSAGFLFDEPALLTMLCLVWGFAVVADSAQFSAAVSELSDERYVGTALTLQTSLGFLLTLATIQILPPLIDGLGWKWGFAVLALGPAAGIVCMARLRALPEARAMAGGKR
jgi:MFS family permease